jgi:hypothetical protein
MAMICGAYREKRPFLVRFSQKCNIHRSYPPPDRAHSLICELGPDDPPLTSLWRPPPHQNGQKSSLVSKKKVIEELKIADIFSEVVRKTATLVRSP